MAGNRLTEYPGCDKLTLPGKSSPPFLVIRMNSQLVEEASKVIPVPQLLINAVSKRVRQLTSGHRPMIDTGGHSMGFSDIALKEIIEGKLIVQQDNGGA